MRFLVKGYGSRICFVVDGVGCKFDVFVLFMIVGVGVVFFGIVFFVVNVVMMYGLGKKFK